MNLVQVSAGTPLILFVIYICVFAFMSPIGIGIGIGIGELAADSVGYSATTGILQGGFKMVKNMYIVVGPNPRLCDSVSNNLLIRFEAHSELEDM